MKLVRHPDPATWKSLLQRPGYDYSGLMPKVEAVFEAVQLRGDQAVSYYTQKYDGVEPESVRISGALLKEAEREISPALATAIRTAKANIENFHRAQQSPKLLVETMEGVICWQEKKPIEKVGLYIPGGTAPLFSTVLMLGVPATIAGCREIVLCTPPGKNGKVHPAIRFTAHLCGIETVYCIGGIQAIGAMTFGTATVPGVYKIFGPGNQYVTAAKQLATGYGVAIDMPAGPSEVLVVADNTAEPSFVAADLLSQAEHGPDSQVVLVTFSEELLEKIAAETVRQLQRLPRQAIAQKALDNSLGILVESRETAVALVNAYAPEHLILAVEDSAFYCEEIVNAGSVFIGNFTPESAGDYASGTNHTLPTNGYARQYSGVNLNSFMKSITYQEISAEGLKRLGPAIEVMAENEALMAHKNAVSIRLAKLTSKKEK